jgi:hypothetical protein
VGEGGEKAKSFYPDKVIEALPGIKQANLTGGISEMRVHRRNPE